MLIVLVKFLLPAVLLFYLLLRILEKKDSKSKSTLVLLLTSLVFNTALAQNYNHNLFPERGDGYSVSNSLAYYVFGEDHFGHWNSDLFRTGYEISINVTMILLVIYIGFLIFERRNNGKENIINN